ncbi:MAG: hypothetical protein LBP92_06060 [Deltaproteobacteria bacterium]|nr:hypothetical protein [Deltaproteobacteria bacterium]
MAPSVGLLGIGRLGRRALARAAAVPGLALIALGAEPARQGQSGEGIGPGERSRLLEALSGLDFAVLVCSLDSAADRRLVDSVLGCLPAPDRAPMMVSVVSRGSLSQSGWRPVFRRLLAASRAAVDLWSRQGLLVQGGRVFEARERLADLVSGLAEGLAEVLARPMEMVLDPSDLRAALAFPGRLAWGLGQASGPDRARRALDRALASGAYPPENLLGAQCLLVLTIGDPGLRLGDFEYLNRRLAALAGERARLFAGLAHDAALAQAGGLKVFFLATGLPGQGTGDRAALFRAGLREWRI